jgi:hypothetical protein
VTAFDGLAIGIGSLKIGDRLNVRGVRVGDRLVAVRTEWVAISVLESGWEPVLVGWRPPLA